MNNSLELSMLYPMWPLIVIITFSIYTTIEITKYCWISLQHRPQVDFYVKRNSLH